MRAAAGLFWGFLAALTTALPSIAAEPIKIGVVRSNGGIPSIIAKEKGYFAAEGIEAELVFFDCAQPISVAVASSDCDFGSTGITAAFYNLAAQGALKIIAAGTWDKQARLPERRHDRVESSPCGRA